MGIVLSVFVTYFHCWWTIVLGPPPFSLSFSKNNNNKKKTFCSHKVFSSSVKMFFMCDSC